MHRKHTLISVSIKIILDIYITKLHKFLNRRIEKIKVL